MTIRIGVPVLTKADVGLSLVDNTADADKPASTAVLEELGLKAPLGAGQAGILGLPVVAERTELYASPGGLAAHTSYAQFGIDSALSATYEHTHRLVVDAGLVYLVYLNPWTNNLRVQCGLADTSNAATSLAGYFGGKREATIEPGGILVSDGFAADKVANAFLYERTYVAVDSGNTWPIQFRTGASRSEATNNRTAGGTLASGGTRSYGAAYIVGTTA